MKTTKKCLSVLLAAVLLLGAVPVTAHAAESVGIMPMWDNTAYVSPSLTISSGTATCKGSIIGISGTTKITATFYLQRKNSDGTFSTVKTWSGLSSTGISLTFSDSYAVTIGKTYRLQCDAVVTKGGVNESVSVVSGEKTA